MMKRRSNVSCRVKRSFMLHRSKILQWPGSLGEWGSERDMTLSLCARLLGGSGIPGEWHCARCNRGGCWHTKPWCFWCSTSRIEGETLLDQGYSPNKGFGNSKGGGGKGIGGQPQPQREQSHRGSAIRAIPAPAFSHAPTCHAPLPCKCWAVLRTFWTR